MGSLVLWTFEEICRDRDRDRDRDREDDCDCLCAGPALAGIADMQ